ncbi:MAG: metallophosphoesterase [Victivallales bacterium]|nr:metallophosphoesterase [Victivallales bacterium]MCF7888756.1 metallophosphoesterase [Victivallales bacterium]
MFTIAQITDSHILPSGELLRGIDARKRFKKTIAEINKYKPDILTVTGDIAGITGTEEIYNWVNSVIKDTVTKYRFFIPGNHDNTLLMKENLVLDLPLNDGELYYSFDTEYYKLVFLDSSTQYLSMQQLDWLCEINRTSEKNIMLFVHHPLDYCGCRFMDRKYPLKNIPEVKKYILSCNKIKYIFTGHYHTEKKIKIGGAVHYITPSTVFQIYQKPYNCVMDKTNFGWRIIEIKDSNNIKTKVNYLKEEVLNEKES